MKKIIYGLAGVASCGLAVSSLAAPDVWVCTLPSTAYWGQAGGIHAFSVATTSANAGTTNLAWVQNSTQHPVIAQNMYRLSSNGVLEQVGMSWLKHGFCALQQNIGCGPCQVQGGCLAFLKPGCADPYSASLNGTTSLLGPRSEVNPSTGVFAWPHAVGDTGTSTTIRSRLQVADADIQPALNPGARWFVEGQYVHPEDAAAGLDNNNATWREINIANFNFNPNSTVSNSGASVGMQAMVEGWATLVPTVQVVNADVTGTGGGRFIVASNATDNGNGTWHYEYAVYNMNVDRSAGDFSVPVPAGVTLTNVSFRAPFYHSGELYSSLPWTTTGGAGSNLMWSTELFSANANANAVRWATMYNFRFDADAAPTTGTATIGLFKSGAAGDPNSVSIAVQAPGAAVVCVGDFNGDGAIDGADLATLLGQWGAAGSADLDGSGTVDAADLAQLLASWGPC